MKRIDRLSETVRHELAMAAMFSTVCVSVGVWVVAAALAGNAPGGVFLAGVAAAALCLAAVHVREARRVAGLIERERQWIPEVRL